MASRRAMEKLEDENRTLCQRLSDVEVELTRKEDALKAANSRKMELLNDLREYQRKVRELKMGLEKAESAELEAQGSSHEARASLEQAEASLRDQSASSKAAIASFQVEIRSLKMKLSEKEDHYEAALEQMHHKDELIAAIQEEKTKLNQEGSSRVANLNQTLMQAKQTCSQIAEENEALKRNERELLDKYEALERKYEALAAQKDAPCKSCLERAHPRTPIRTPRKAYATPVKPIPEETELDTLQIENIKLKQELQCLHTNFQVTSQKSSDLRKEMREMEKSLTELQAVCDQMLAENEDLKQKYAEAKAKLTNKADSETHSRERNARLEKDVTGLGSQLESLQQKNYELQDKLKTEIAKHLLNQDAIGDLDAHTKELKEEKAAAERNLIAAQAQLQELQEQVSSYQQSTANHSEIQRRSSAAIEAYERKLASLADQKFALREQLDSAAEALVKVQYHVSSLERTKKSLEVKLARLETQNQLLSIKAKGASSSESEGVLRNELGKLAEQCHALSLENKELQEAQVLSKSQIQELTRASTKHHREANHHWELAKKLQKELEKQESRLLTADEELQAKQQQCSKMASEVEDLKLELSSETNAKKMFEIEVGRLINKLEELEQINFELSTRLADVQNETKVARVSQIEVHSRLEEADRKLRATEDTLLEKEAQNTELRNTIELMERENATLLSQVNSLSEMASARNAKIDALNSHLAQYESDSHEIAARISELEADHGHCAQVRRELQEENHSLKETVQDALSYRMEVDTSILSLKLELKQLQEYNGSLEAINSGLQEKIKSQITRNEELASRCLDTEKSLHDLEQELKLKSSSFRAALEEVDFTKKSSEDAQTALKTELEALEARCSELKDLCEDQRQEKIDMTSQIKQIRNEMRELQHVHSSMKNVKVMLSERYDRSRAEVASLTENLLALKSELKQAQVELKHQKQKGVVAERQASLTKEQLTQTVDQYEKLKESALSLLEQSGSMRSENAGVSTPTKRLKGILKNAGVLKPVENI